MLKIYSGILGFDSFNIEVIISWPSNYIWMDIISPKPLLSSYLKTSNVHRSLKNGIKVPSLINSTQTLICWKKKYVDSNPDTLCGCLIFFSKIVSVQQSVREKKSMFT